jgi:putative ABC transport system permease protein
VSPGAVGRAVRGGIGRRRGVQTIVIALVLVVSTASSVLGLALVADSHATFDNAFSEQHGADVVATVDTSRATQTQLAATARLPQMSAAAGPFAEANVTATDRSPGVGVTPLPALTLVGRATPGGPVDDVTLQAGHWPRRTGQIVMGANTNVFDAGIGDTVTVTSAPGKPRLKVVGLATSVSQSADGWVVPAEISALRSPDAPATAEMLYRFRSAGSAAAVRAGGAAVTRALPAGAVADAQSYLNVRAAQQDQIGVYSPFVVAFAIIGLVMSVLIVANVVSGAVISGYHRIGILKSIGFTPGQVIAAYTGQVLVPAVVGCLGGVALGNLLAVPVLNKAADVYGVGRLGVPLWVNVAVPLAMCSLVALAAVLPALRAGRLSATQALAAGRAPRTGRGYLADRVLGRLALPRPITIGLASPFARPARMAATLAAVLLGVTAVTFAVGLVASLRRATSELDLTGTEQVSAYYNGPGGPSGGCPENVVCRSSSTPPRQTQPSQPSSAQSEHAVAAAVRSLSGTAHYALEEDNQYVKVSGLVQAIQVTGFVGDAGWIYTMSSGHWYTGPDQAVVPERFLQTLHIAVGDTVTITGANGRAIPVRIVGEVFDKDDDGLTMLTDWRTLTAADPGLTPNALNTQYDIGLRAGTNPTAYAQALGAKLGSNYSVTANFRGGGAAIAIALAGLLTLLLSIAAGLGVLNTVVLHTRERVHDLGVFKAVGMTPRQTVATVLSSVALIGLLAGVLAVPAGIVVHHYVIPAMAGAAGIGVPPSLQNVYGAGEIAALALAGLIIALAGALLPAGWAAKSRTAAALRAE